KEPCQQALTPEIVCRCLVDAVEIERRSGFAGNVHQLRRFGLHAKGKLIRLNDTLELRVALCLFQMLAVERLDEIKLLPLQLKRRLWIADVSNLGLCQRRGLPADRRALVNRRQKRRAISLRTRN